MSNDSKVEISAADLMVAVNALVRATHVTSPNSAFTQETYKGTSERFIDVLARMKVSDYFIHGKTNQEDIN